MSLPYRESYQTIIREVEALLDSVELPEVERFLQVIEHEWRGKRLFFWARGRSFLVLRGFAMRLMHMGYQVHLVGEPDCPSVRSGDVLMTASGSGSTSSILLFAEKAGQAGAQVAAVIGHGGSPLEKLADHAVTFHPERCPESIQLQAGAGGTRFEHALFLFFDSCILSLIHDRRKEVYQEMMYRHANLE